MSDLTEFLLQRIAEDEAVARAADAPYFLYDLEGKAGEQYDHIARHDPARVLAQCAALREVVERHVLRTFYHPGGSQDLCQHCSDDWPCADLRALASIWSSHPDYPLED